MIDPELVTRKMVLISRDLNAVVTIAGKALDTYLASATDEVLGERWLQFKQQVISSSARVGAWLSGVALLAITGMAISDRPRPPAASASPVSIV